MSRSEITVDLSWSETTVVLNKSVGDQKSKSVGDQKSKLVGDQKSKLVGDQKSKL